MRPNGNRGPCLTAAGRKLLLPKTPEPSGVPASSPSLSLRSQEGKLRSREAERLCIGVEQVHVSVGGARNHKVYGTPWVPGLGRKASLSDLAVWPQRRGDEALVKATVGQPRFPHPLRKQGGGGVPPQRTLTAPREPTPPPGGLARHRSPQSVTGCSEGARPRRPRSPGDSLAPAVG